MLDSNNDGKVNTKDLQEMLTRLGIEIKEEIIDELMKLAVGHQQGAEIDENDFLQWVKKIQELLPETTCQDPHKDLMAAFKVFDLDNNGFITRDEIKVAMEKMGEPVTEDQITEMIIMADMDMDGKINYEGKIYITYVIKGESEFVSSIMHVLKIKLSFHILTSCAITH